MIFEPGDLLLIPFPFTDLSSSKRRPVLALTAPDSLGDFIGLPVTSRRPTEHGLPLSGDDLLTGSLPSRSWIRIDRPVSLSGDLVVKVIGRASGAVRTEAVRRLCTLLSGAS